MTARPGRGFWWNVALLALSCFWIGYDTAKGIAWAACMQAVLSATFLFLLYRQVRRQLFLAALNPQAIKSLTFSAARSQKLATDRLAASLQQVLDMHEEMTRTGTQVYTDADDIRAALAAYRGVQA